MGGSRLTEAQRLARQPPRRLIRLAAEEQRGLAVAYALAIAERQANWPGSHRIGPNREALVTWEGHPLSPGGRWMIPPRTLRTAVMSMRWAEAMAEGEGATTPPTGTLAELRAPGTYSHRLIIWLRRLHRRAAKAPVATAVIDRRSTSVLRGSMAPRRAWLARHIASQRRRLAEREARAANAALLDWLLSP